MKTFIRILLYVNLAFAGLNITSIVLGNGSTLAAIAFMLNLVAAGVCHLSLKRDFECLR